MENLFSRFWWTLRRPTMAEAAKARAEKQALNEATEEAKRAKVKAKCS
jgi:hypothetical protein